MAAQRAANPDPQRETWLVQCRDGYHDDEPVPLYVEREFRHCLDRGILAHGFARARCGRVGTTW